MFCKTKTNGTRSRNWTFPDGTTCRSKSHAPNDISYCIGGRCERFSCDNSSSNYFKIDPIFCGTRDQNAESNSIEGSSSENRRHSSVPVAVPWYQQQTRNRDIKSNNRERGGGIMGPTTVRSKYENGKVEFKI